MIKFLVLTSTYNRPKLLKKCINSVLKQTYSQWKMIIIDDNSKKEIKKEIEGYLKDRRIKFLKNKKNKGVNFTRNKGLDYLSKNYSNRWVVFLDDDDWLNENCLKKAQEIIQKQPSYKWFLSNKILNKKKVTNVKKKKKNIII
jgi:glycosyltransferase involved in cell wall biosynthesis